MIYDYEKDADYVNCIYADIGSMNEYITVCGSEIEQWDTVIFAYDSAEGAVFTDYLANLYRWFVVSLHFRQAAKNILEKQVQYLPVKIINKTTKEEMDSYCVANIVTVVDALDMDKSKYDVYELDDEKIISVEKYALKGSKIEGKHIFRLKDDTIPIFVSEELKKIIEDNCLTGFDFLEVDVT
jgi:hypothetical protein